MLAIAGRRYIIRNRAQAIIDLYSVIHRVSIGSIGPRSHTHAGFRLMPITLLAFGLLACNPQPLETLVRCERIPESMCGQLTPVVIDAVPSAQRSSVVEIRIVCDTELCTPSDGAYRAWVRSSIGPERELPEGQWASG